jgi:hypothetical protein
VDRGAVHVAEVQAIGGVVVDEGILDQELAAGVGGAQAVAVAAGLLRPAGPGLAGGDALAAAVPGDFDVAQDDLAGVGTAAADVEVPADAAVLVDLDALHGPVGEAAGLDPAGGQAMDVEVVQPDVVRGAGGDAAAGIGHRQLVQVALALEWSYTQSLASVISRLPISTLELPTRLSTSTPLVPTSLAPALPRRRVRALEVGPLGTDCMAPPLPIW